MTRTVLTVDDSRTMREMVAFTLRGAGYTVLEAGDGREALRVLGGKTVDAIITDLNMPGMDGLTLIRELRAQPAYKSVPILMLTTEADAQKKQDGKAAGATGWIVKPFSPDKLIAVVKQVAG